MKANPIIIIAILFAVAFAGRAVGIASAAANREDPQDASAPAGVSTAPPEAIASAASVMADNQAAPEDKTPKANTQNTAPAPVQATAPVSAAQRAAQNASLTDAIRARTEAVDAKEASLEERLRVLEAVEKRIDEKLIELRKSHEALEQLVSYANEASEKDIALLARMYEQMKPQKAGEIFDKMNPTFAAGFLTEMNSENAALILANMSTDNAYEASMIIASRNAAVHKQ